MRSLFLAGTLVCVSSAVVRAQPSELAAEAAEDPRNGSGVEPQSVFGDAAIAAMLEKLLHKHELPGGMVAGVVVRNRVSAIGAAGYRQDRSGERMTINDKLHIGSCTKAMTATMIATLVDEGRLAWDATLGELLSDVEIHAGFREVTLRQLLAHRAGLPRNAPGTIGTAIGQWLRRDPRSDRQKRSEIVAAALKDKPQFEPGSRYAYSNLGYIIAGNLAERAADLSWEELMRERLFNPLGMESAGFGPPGEPDRLHQPWGHIELPLVGWTSSQRDNPSFLGPAGTVHCTLADWGRFASLHLGHPPVERPLLKPETLASLHEAVPSNASHGKNDRPYALGWLVAERDWAEGQTLTHAGSNTMWYAIIWIAPEIESAFLVAANSGDAFDACDEAIGELIDYSVGSKR